MVRGDGVGTERRRCSVWGPRPRFLVFRGGRVGGKRVEASGRRGRRGDWVWRGAGILPGSEAEGARWGGVRVRVRVKARGARGAAVAEGAAADRPLIGRVRGLCGDRLGMGFLKPTLSVTGGRGAGGRSKRPAGPDTTHHGRAGRWCAPGHGRVRTHMMRRRAAAAG
jgi:hypothetical protein